MTDKIINVLLVEDDIDDCNFFKTALAGIPLLTSLSILRDGDLMIDFLKKNEYMLPDIIFLDLSMPRKTGIECLSDIKEIEQFKNIPVVMLSTSYTGSSNFEPILIKSIMGLGAFDFIRKPDTIKSLQHSIYKLIQQVTNLHPKD